MTAHDFANLPNGSIIQNKGSGSAYVVVGHAGNQPIVSRTFVACNPSEWIAITQFQSAETPAAPQSETDWLRAHGLADLADPADPKPAKSP